MLLVHLPIGMIVVLAALEIAACFARFKNAAVSVGYILALAAPLAVVSAICGWLLSLGGGYDENLLAWHKWLGISTAAMILVAAIFFLRRKLIAYRVTLFAAVGLLMAAGHLGGSLTHGSDYLTQYAPGPLKKLFGLDAAKKSPALVAPADPLSAPIFAGIIEPIFQSKCVSCHGPAKAKGGLRLDSFATVQKGSEDGLVLKPGQSAQSPLVQRVLLPADTDDHMPPAGKPQLTAAEIALLKWWIDAGAPETNTLGQFQPASEIPTLPSAK